MKLCSRNLALVLFTLLFVCVLDNVVWLLLPHILKAANKTAAKAFKMATKLHHLVHHI